MKNETENIQVSKIGKKYSLFLCNILIYFDMCVTGKDIHKMKASKELGKTNWKKAKEKHKNI